MNTFKVKAVRMALIHTELDIINDFIEKQGEFHSHQHNPQCHHFV